MKTMLFIISFLCIYSECSGINSRGILINEVCASSKDSMPQRAFGTLKINPFQILACEIPVSFEIYKPGESSLQLQIGYILSGKNSPMAAFFETWGAEGTAQDSYLISYRRSPYNNDGGINFKIEFRKYKHFLGGDRSQPYSSGYFASQLMYKYTYYNHKTFTKKDGTSSSDFTYYQTESKDSNIFGFGFIFGRQSCTGKFVTDWYGGFGFRITAIKAKIHEIDYYWTRPGYPKYPDTTETDVGLYPFINFGLRMGFEL